MKRFLAIALLLSVSLNAFFILSPEPVETQAEEQVEITTAAGRRFETVARVIDGDTFLIAANWSPYPLEWKIRISGIDTPEKGARADCARERELSAQAMQLTETLVRESLGRVRLVNVDHDKYGGRLNADVILASGKSLGQEQIKAGLARPYNGDGPKPNWCRP